MRCCFAINVSALLFVTSSAAFCATPEKSAVPNTAKHPQYKIIKTIPLSGDTGWDYLTADSEEKKTLYHARYVRRYC